MKRVLFATLLVAPSVVFAECQSFDGYTSCVTMDGDHAVMTTTGPNGYSDTITSRTDSDGNTSSYSTGSSGSHSMSIHPMRDGNSIIRMDGKVQVCSRSKCY